MYIPEPDDADEMRMLARANRMYQAELMRHPDCRDPDHPGCPRCSGEEDERENNEEDVSHV